MSNPGEKPSREEWYGQVLVAGVIGFAGVAVAFHVANAMGVSLLQQTLTVTIGTAVALTLAGYVYVDQKPAPDVATVDIDGKIAREGDALIGESGADAVTTAIEDADENGAGSLLVSLNSPGGEIVPSEDIRRAVRDFDGPTVGVAEDVCASGAYLIASACDHVVCRESGMVGSIGVVGSRPNFSGLADELGVEYEQLTAGEYKDAGHPLKDADDEDREYLQGLIDTHYDTFVRRVAEGRGLSKAAVRDTEARVYLGPQAVDLGLADAVGDEGDAREYLQEQLGADDDDIAVDAAHSSSGELNPLAAATTRFGYSIGAGLASRLPSADSFSFELR